jgi:ABC-type sugar transport system ATPase subunit
VTTSRNCAPTRLYIPASKKRRRVSRTEALLIVTGVVILSSDIILHTKNISKRYPGVQALKDVDFELRRGEIQAIVGQNGAGKSTFIEIIAGSLSPDEGDIWISDKRYSQLDPSISIELGIQTVHQENLLVDGLSVAENILLYDLPVNRFGFADLAVCVEKAGALLQQLEIKIDPETRLSDLTFVEKKLVSIAKAFSRKAKILILDEPTASLDKQGRTILFDIVRKSSQKGLSVIYISHHLSEIFEICDRVTIFKDGLKVDTSDVRTTEMATIVQKMIGQSSTTLISRRQDDAPEVGAEILEVVDYSRANDVDHVSFNVRKGEIFGLTGLVGAGRTELARMIFGLDRKDSGKLFYKGTEITPRNPSDAIAKGLGYLTEDRKDDGLFLVRPVFENISTVMLTRIKDYFINLKNERASTSKTSKQLTVKTPTVKQLVINLSGGNQQKVVLAKWLYAESGILIFDEPTVGIDVGSKSEIYQLMFDLAKKGKVIIVISSDTPELITICNRVGIMRYGKLTEILENDQITEENILRLSMGVE